MLASSVLDPVLGIDIHFEMVPTPAPVPLPIPNPFSGLVFDPLGLAAGIAIGAAIGAVVGAPFQGPVLYWAAFPATNTGTEAKHVPGHILIPPGTAWAPFPKTPKPVIRPGEVPAPGLPVKPENDAVVITGSKTVTVMGSNAVRLGDIALSCSEPLRLPSSVVLAIPKGAPILIGGPPSLDLMAAAMASLRTRFVSDSLHALLSRLRPSRFRNFFHRAVCFFTGHPVDVASGKVMTESADIELPGPIPLKVERIYSSAFASRPGPLGHGWSLSLDQAVWRERGKVVLLSEDGREIEFDTLDFPKHRLEPGQRIYNPIERLTLCCDKGEAWRVVDHEGVVRHFGPVPGRDGGWAMIHKIVSRCGYHEIGFHYGAEGPARGRLEWVRDSGGRFLHLRYDGQGRVTELHLPQPQGEGFYQHRRYEYDEAGDLVRVTDSLGHDWRFVYITHLLTQETDRNGLSFYFQYDGLGEDAWCVRTWGDGGIYDHTLGYDKQKHITYVTNSLGHTTQYHMNVVGQVVKVVDPLGGKTTYDYDPVTLMRVATTDPLGRETRVERDAMGHITRRQQPDGTSIGMRYDSRLGLPVQLELPDGATWFSRYDPVGRLERVVDPVGRHRQHVWDGRGLLQAVTTDEGTTILAHDVYKQLVSMKLPGGVEHRYGYDALGRAVRVDDPAGVTTIMTFDTEGRHLQTAGPLGVWERMDYDPEGNLVRALRPNRDVELRRGHFHRVVERVEAGTTARFQYDSEGHLLGVINEAGEAHRFVLDELGRVKEETTLDGRTRRFIRDAGDRIIGVIEREGRTDFGFDVMDRLVEVRHGDGAEEYAYDLVGRMQRATNAHADVVFERDALGRVTAESQDGGKTWVRSSYGGRTHRIDIHSDLGAHQEIERDSLGEIKALIHRPPSSDAGPVRIEVDRDPLGHELVRRLPGSIQVSWKRDVVGRPQERIISHPDAGGALGHQQYQWRGDSQIASIARDGDDIAIYTHDWRGRLVREERPRAGRVVDRSMDEVDNVIASGRHRFGAGGRLLAAGQRVYEHDERGRQVACVEPDGRRWGYRWSSAGLLEEVARPDGKRVRFSYDPFARRTSKRLVEVAPDGTEHVEAERRFVWDGATVIHERDPHLPNEQGLTTWYWESDVHGPVLKDGPQGRFAVVTDHHGRPSDLFDEGGRRVWRMRLDVLGAAEVSEGEPTDCPWRWPGQYEDPETGDLYNRWRYYDPSTGVYRSPDPVGLWGGLRPYAYPADPLTQIDPLGWMPLSIPTNRGHHIIPHSAASTLGVSPFNSEFGAPSYYFIDPPRDAHSVMHGYNMGLDSLSRPAVTDAALARQGLDADGWLQSLRNHYSRPELAGLRGDLRIVTSTGPGEVIARNLSPLEAFVRALEWGRERGGCY